MQAESIPNRHLAPEEFSFQRNPFFWSNIEQLFLLPLHTCEPWPHTATCRIFVMWCTTYDRNKHMSRKARTAQELGRVMMFILFEVRRCSQSYWLGCMKALESKTLGHHHQ